MFEQVTQSQEKEKPNAEDLCVWDRLLVDSSVITAGPAQEVNTPDGKIVNSYDLPKDHGWTSIQSAVFNKDDVKSGHQILSMQKFSINQERGFLSPSSNADAYDYQKSDGKVTLHKGDREVKAGSSEYKSVIAEIDRISNLKLPACKPEK